MWNDSTSNGYRTKRTMDGQFCFGPKEKVKANARQSSAGGYFNSFKGMNGRTKWQSLNNVNKMYREDGNSAKRRFIKLAWTRDKDSCESVEFTDDDINVNAQPYSILPARNLSSISVNAKDDIKKLNTLVQTNDKGGKTPIDIFLATAFTKHEQTNEDFPETEQVNNETAEINERLEDTLTSTMRQLTIKLVTTDDDDDDVEYHKNIPEEPSRKYWSSIENEFIDEENESKRKPFEKRVTFATDIPKPALSAEMRRENFRNSYSKMSAWTTNKCIGSRKNRSAPSTLRNASLECKITVTNSEESLEKNECSDSGDKQFQLETEKSTTIDKSRRSLKRKLKSCRTSTFHKSFDSSNTVQVCEILRSPGTAIPRIASMPNLDVVTMVGLLNSPIKEPANTEMQSKINNSKVSCNAKPQYNVKKNNKLPPSATCVDKITDFKTGGERRNVSLVGMKGLSPWSTSNRVASELDKAKKPFYNRMLKFSRPVATETNRSIEPNDEPKRTIRPNMVRALSVDPSANRRIGPKFLTMASVAEECPNLRSTKEQECWKSFKKMENGGVTITFDTILRGLLTPTEYRLRKDHLLTTHT